MTTYFCNKCGYAGPVQHPHQRPDGRSECAYMACAVPPSPPGQCKHLSECKSPEVCFNFPPGCRRTPGEAAKENGNG